jgi:replicative DNA helicase
MAEIIVAKNRNGSLNTVKLKFLGRYTKFADYDATYNFVDETDSSYNTRIGTPNPGVEGTRVSRSSKMNDMDYSGSGQDLDAPF